MRAKLISEATNFKRGVDPYDALMVGAGSKIEMTHQMQEIMETELMEDRDEWTEMYSDFKDSIGFEDYEFIGHYGMFENYPEFEELGKKIEDIKTRGSIIKRGVEKFKPSQEWHSNISKIPYTLYSHGLLEIEGGYFMRNDLIDAE